MFLRKKQYNILMESPVEAQVSDQLEDIDQFTERFPYLFSMRKVYPSLEVSFKKVDDNKFRLETVNTELSTSVTLRKATLGDFMDHSKGSCQFNPEDYLVAEDLLIGARDTDPIDIMQDLRKRNTIFVTCIKNPELDEFIDKLNGENDICNEEIVSDLKEMVYGSYGYGVDGPHGNLVMSPLPVSVISLFIFLHELGHLQPDSIKQRLVIEQVYKQLGKGQEELDKEADENSYTDERNASAFALNKMRKFGRVLGFNVDGSLKKKLHGIVAASLYSKGYEKTGLLQLKNKPAMFPEASSKDFKGYQIYRALNDLVKKPS